MTIFTCSVELEIRNSSGVHVRPAGIIARTLANVQSEVTLIYNNKRVNAKSIMSILTLGIPQGAKIELCAKGTDAEHVIQEIAKLVESGFGETCPH